MNVVVHDINGNKTKLHNISPQMKLADVFLYVENSTCPSKVCFAGATHDTPVGDLNSNTIVILKRINSFNHNLIQTEESGNTLHRIASGEPVYSIKQAQPIY